MHFLRHGVQGIDVTHLSDKVIAFSSQPPNSTYKVMRDGAFVSQVPTVVGPVSVSFLSNLDLLNKNQGPPEPWCYKEYLRAQSASPVPVKYTLPGPMTLMDGSFNRLPSVHLASTMEYLVRLLAQGLRLARVQKTLKTLRED